MSDLERARAHLLLWQDLLYERRKLGWDASPEEECVLAALSWVWEEQEKLSFRDNDYDVGFADGMAAAEAAMAMPQ